MQVHTLLWRGLLGFFLSLTFSHAIFRPGWRLQKHHGYVKTLAGTTQLDPRYGPFYFNQPIDHFTANSRTFKQRFWANTDWYEPGGPVILYNAGETAADERSAYVTNSSMALLARDLRGIIIVMEHRSYGRSQPGTDYSVKYLKTLTTAQALEDMANIIRTVKLPNLEGELPPPPATRWIVYGGSYSGNLAAWMREKYPDLVFAAVASSAPVELRYNFYQYFQAVQQYAPRHCVHAIQMVMQYVDHILYGPFESGKRRLRRRFGVEELEHDDDFAECK
ncbi:serine carboxypeptidase S28-domain-containing protein [Radiomyces spectabilis]|uniref:serine carboxypeptidase S28-domain-containing protein n=1 Tax=Radiomyces spectabilis TaxID=64574 RepID=UPI002221206A|nr:serine carboxypeptidase S28-domain-containing protein [Radiomyces spectabilis]KAI8369234.1 serine carboxypeptidase S28-domain-containing protein [Radiomyces spectabilis]